MAKNKQPPKDATPPEITIILPVTLQKHFDRNGGHINVMFGEIDNNYVSVATGTTKNNKMTGYPLDVDPLGGGDTVYMERRGTVAPKREYSKKHLPGQMSERNYKKAKRTAENAKQEYIAKRNKKK